MEGVAQSFQVTLELCEGITKVIVTLNIEALCLGVLVEDLQVFTVKDLRESVVLKDKVDNYVYCIILSRSNITQPKVELTGRPNFYYEPEVTRVVIVVT